MKEKNLSQTFFLFRGKISLTQLIEKLIPSPNHPTTTITSTTNINPDTSSQLFNFWEISYKTTNVINRLILKLRFK